MNKKSHLIIVLNILISILISTVITLNDDQFYNNPTLTSALFNFTSANRNSSMEAKSLPVISTNELWRQLSKLRIGSFFTSKPRSMNCECPNQPAYIPMPIVPVVERIHHHYDKHLSRPSTNKLFESTKAFDSKKQLYNSPSFYEKVTSPEQSIRKTFSDKNGFTGLNHIMSDNGRSIPTFTNPFDNQHNQPTYTPFNPAHQDANLYSLLHNSILPGKDESNELYDELNSLDKQIINPFIDLKGHSNGQRDLGAEKVHQLVQWLQRLMSEMESNQRDLYKMKILRLIGELEQFMLMKNEKWTSGSNDHVAKKVNEMKLSTKWPSSRSVDQFFTNNFSNILMNNASDETIRHSNERKLSTLFRNKKLKNLANDENGFEVDDEYFSDYHLPSESVVNNQTIENDFLPIVDPQKLWGKIISKDRNKGEMHNEMKVRNKITSKKSTNDAYQVNDLTKKRLSKFSPNATLPDRANESAIELMTNRK